MALRASAAGRHGRTVLTVRQAVERGVVLRAVHAPGNISLLEARPARPIRRQLDEVSLLITVAAGLSAISVHCVACSTSLDETNSFRRFAPAGTLGTGRRYPG